MSRNNKGRCVKVVLLGQAGVGKTQFWNQITFRGFRTGCYGIGASCEEVAMTAKDGSSFSVCLWDTAGCERFQSLGTAFYRGAEGAICFFDAKDPTATLASLEPFIAEFREHWAASRQNSSIPISEESTEPIPMVLVASRIDLIGAGVEGLAAKNRAQTAASSFMAKWDIPHYMEVSAKENHNVKAVLQRVVDCMSSWEVLPYEFDAPKRPGGVQLPVPLSKNGGGVKRKTNDDEKMCSQC